MHIKKKTLFDHLMLAYVKSHNYNLDSNLEKNKDKDTIISFLSSFSNMSSSLAFVWSACNTNKVSCSLFSALLVYQAHIKDS